VEAPTSAHIFQIAAKQTNFGVRTHLRAGFVEFLIVNQHFPRDNQSLSSLA
jgi:hypothetical protein